MQYKKLALGAGLVLGMLGLGGVPLANAGAPIKLGLVAVVAKDGATVEFTLVVANAEDGELEEFVLQAAPRHCFPKLLTVGPIELRMGVGRDARSGGEWEVEERGCSIRIKGKLGAFIVNGRWRFTLQFGDTQGLPRLPVLLSGENQTLTAAARISQVPIALRNEAPVTVDIGQGASLPVQTAPILGGCEYEIIVEEAPEAFSIKQLQGCLVNPKGRLNAKGEADPLPAFDTASLASIAGAFADKQVTVSVSVRLQSGTTFQSRPVAIRLVRSRK